LKGVLLEELHGQALLDRFSHRDYVSLTMEFRCNLKCVHCMIEDTMDRLKPQTDETFDQLLAFNKINRKWRGLILTGSEITLRSDLPEIARKARSCGFDHVRIQTHGMHLGRRQYAASLVSAGVDEYFVSVAGHDAATHDAITTVSGSFEKTLRGLEILDNIEGVMTMTNTVVTSESYRFLPDVVDRLGHLKRLAQMEFWVYWPMTETDEKNLVAAYSDLVPTLRVAMARARQLGRRVEVKNVPQCMLEEDGGALVNGQPQLFIDPDFWKEFSRNGFYQCVYRDQCSSKECLGLSSAYIKKFGNEREKLRPIPSRAT
jgi:MoaA/NifB/PqqE/SkfB family radical SAM enzyme